MLGLLTTFVLLVMIGIFAFVAFALGSGLGLFIVAFLVVVMLKHIMRMLNEKDKT